MAAAPVLSYGEIGASFGDRLSGGLRSVRHRTNIRRFTMAALLVTTLTACGGGDDPSADPTEALTSASASASPTTEPTPTKPEKPVLPAAAKPATKAGAEAFGEYFWEVLNYTYFTGDTSVMKKISRVGCDACDSVINGIERDYASGGRYRGSRWQFMSSTFVNQTDPTAPFAGKTVADVGPQILDRQGKKDRRFPSLRLTVTMAIYPTDSGWQVGYMEPRES